MAEPVLSVTGRYRTSTDRSLHRMRKKAGYVQLELEVVAENRSAIALYESVGFVEYGRNPKDFRSRLTGWQEVVLMRLELGGQSAM